MPGPIILRGEIMRPIGPKESLPDPAAAELVNGIRSEHGKAKHFEGQAHYHQDMAEDALDRIIKLAKKLKDEHGPSPERRAKMVEEIEEKIAARKEARENESWQLADEIRDELAEEGIELMDKAWGTIWRVD